MSVTSGAPQGSVFWPFSHFYHQPWWGDWVQLWQIFWQHQVGQECRSAWERLCGGIWISWINGPYPDVWHSAWLNARCCTWVTTTLHSGTGSGKSDWKVRPAGPGKFWATNYKNNVEFPEIVQRTATRLVKGLKTRLVRNWGYLSGEKKAERRPHCPCDCLKGDCSVEVLVSFLQW